MHKGVDPKGFFEKKKRNVVINSYKLHRANEIRKHKDSPTLTENMGTGGHNVPMIMDYRKDEGLRPRKDGNSPSLTSHGDSQGGIPIPMVSDNLMIRDGRDNRSCLRSGRTSELGVSGISLRRLTPIECERLQGFPDNWTIGSDTQRYKQLGNAVTTNVIQAIVKKIIEVM